MADRQRKTRETVKREQFVKRRSPVPERGGKETEDDDAEILWMAQQCSVPGATASESRDTEAAGKAVDSGEMDGSKRKQDDMDDDDDDLTDDEETLARKVSQLEVLHERFRTGLVAAHEAISRMQAEAIPVVIFVRPQEMKMKMFRAKINDGQTDLNKFVVVLKPWANPVMANLPHANELGRLRTKLKELVPGADVFVKDPSNTKRQQAQVAKFRTELAAAGKVRKDEIETGWPIGTRVKDLDHPDAGSLEHGPSKKYFAYKVLSRAVDNTGGV